MENFPDSEDHGDAVTSPDPDCSLDTLTSLEKKLAEEKDEMHHYCELGTWHLMVAVSIIYGLVLVFRVLVIVGDVLGVSRSWSRSITETSAGAGTGAYSLDISVTL